jgi:hypothetical protein
LKPASPAAKNKTAGTVARSGSFGDEGIHIVTANV